MTSRKRPAASGTTADFAGAFAGLKALLERHAAHLTPLTDQPKHYVVAMRSVTRKGKPLWFGSVQTMKNYVSFHLLPVYMNRTLQQQVSPELQKRMQGKACFNFTAPDAQLFRELATLTTLGLKHFRAMPSS